MIFESYIVTDPSIESEFGIFISFLSEEQNNYFNVAIFSFFFPLVLSILPESCLQLKEYVVLLRFAKIFKNSEFILLLGTHAFSGPGVSGGYIQQHSRGL